MLIKLKKMVDFISFCTATQGRKQRTIYRILYPTNHQAFKVWQRNASDELLQAGKVGLGRVPGTIKKLDESIVIQQRNINRWNMVII